MLTLIRVDAAPVLPITEPERADLLLYHYYVHTLPQEAPINIPPQLTFPLLQIGAEI
jgi:hypothetical protein